MSQPDVRPREGGRYSLYCYSCGEWVPNNANHEMQREGCFSHSHSCTPAIYPQPAGAKEAEAFAREIQSVEGAAAIDDGFDWFDTNDAEPILDPELRRHFVAQVQAMKTGSPFLKTMLLRFDATVRHLLATAPRAPNGL